MVNLIEFQKRIMPFLGFELGVDPLPQEMLKLLKDLIIFEKLDPIVLHACSVLLEIENETDHERLFRRYAKRHLDLMSESAPSPLAISICLPYLQPHHQEKIAETILDHGAVDKDTALSLLAVLNELNPVKTKEKVERFLSRNPASADLAIPYILAIDTKSPKAESILLSKIKNPNCPPQAYSIAVEMLYRTGSNQTLDYLKKFLLRDDAKNHHFAYGYCLHYLAALDSKTAYLLAEEYLSGNNHDPFIIQKSLIVMAMHVEKGFAKENRLERLATFWLGRQEVQHIPDPLIAPIAFVFSDSEAQRISGRPYHDKYMSLDLGSVTPRALISFALLADAIEFIFAETPSLSQKIDYVTIRFPEKAEIPMERYTPVKPIWGEDFDPTPAYSLELKLRSPKGRELDAINEYTRTIFSKGPDHKEFPNLF